MQVSSNGLISFREPYNIPSRSSGGFNATISPPLIAPFWDDISIIEEGTIYYREVVDDELLFDRLEQAIRDGHQDVGGFYPSLVFVATWDHVPSYDSNSEDLKNTFQCVLITNGSVTFAVFNYETMEWGGDGSLIGVTVGDRKNFIAHPLSQNVDVQLLSNTTILYRIDGKLYSVPVVEEAMLFVILCRIAGYRVLFRRYETGRWIHLQ